jgi:hypothetical protein
VGASIEELADGSLTPFDDFVAEFEKLHPAVFAVPG